MLLRLMLIAVALVVYCVQVMAGVNKCTNWAKYDLISGWTTSCKAGKYCQKFGTLHNACFTCARNHYCPGGSNFCILPGRSCANPTSQISCGENSCSDPGATSVDECYICCPGGEEFSTVTAKCVDCPPGKYNDGTNGIQCLPCVAGTYVGTAGAHGCDICPTGKTSSAGASVCGCQSGYEDPAGTTSCSQCTAGSYNPDVGALTCLECPAGKYQDSPGQTNCIDCGEDTYRASTGAAQDTDCLSCRTGTNSMAGSSMCSSCPEGKYAVVETRTKTSCYDCPAGRFSANSGASSISACENCPKGKYGVGTGKSDEAGACIDCARGRYADMEGLTDCTPCGFGKYGKTPSAESADSCIGCTSGKYSDGTGVASVNGDPCKVCGIGKYSTNESAAVDQVCMDCGDGEFTLTKKSSMCMKCEPGKSYRNPNSVRGKPGISNGGESVSGRISGCEPCDEGKYTSEHGTIDCLPCPLGRYAPKTGSIKCAVCPRGKTTLETGAAKACKIDSPSSAPSGAPTSTPTTSKVAVTVAEQHTRLNMSDLQSGAGLHLTGVSQFSKIGFFPEERYYLTISVYDTGFGPASSGQYATFFINDEPLMAPGSEGKGSGSGSGGNRGGGQVDEEEDESADALRCAPVQNNHRSDACTRKDFVVCQGGYNIDITDKVQVASGGSLKIKVLTKGVLTSYCPYQWRIPFDDRKQYRDMSSDVYVKYTITTFTQPTPYPTSMPSPAPTEWSGVINNNNGLQLGINTMDVWTLMQIAFAVGCVMAGVGVALAALRKKDPSVQQLALPVSALRSGMLGGEIVTMLFLIFTLFQFDHSGAGLVITIFRFLQMSVGCYFLLGLYGSEQMKEKLGLCSLVATDHMVQESKVYTAVSLFMIIDSAYVVFLPWKASQFGELSKGYPNMHVFTVTAASVILQCFVSICAQAPFLAAASFDMTRDFMSVVNIIILSIKIIAFGSEFVMKRSLLLKKTTAVDEEHEAVEGGKGKKGSASDDGGESGEVGWTENPMRSSLALANGTTAAAMAGGNAPNDTPTDSDRATLLQKVADAEAIAAQARDDVFQLRQWVQSSFSTGQAPKPKPSLAPDPQKGRSRSSRGSSSQSEEVQKHADFSL